MKHLGFNIFFGIVVAAVVVVVGLGFYFSGTPQSQRDIRADEKRLNDLRQISSAIDNYFYANQSLPKQVSDLQNERYAYIESTKDPITQQPYQYRVISDRLYELCATFQTDIQNQDQTKATSPYGGMFEPYWKHPVGEKCFKFTLKSIVTGVPTEKGQVQSIPVTE